MPPPPPSTIARDVQVSSPGGDQATVRVAVPAAWVPRNSSAVLENEYREAIAGVQFTIICNAGCTDADLARMPAIVDGTIERRARPNVNTGDPALDAVRLEIADVDGGALPDGTFRVARVRKPAGKSWPIADQLVAVCVRGRRGGKVIAVQAWAPLEREQELGPVLVAAGKGFEIR